MKDFFNNKLSTVVYCKVRALCLVYLLYLCKKEHTQYNCTACTATSLCALYCTCTLSKIWFFRTIFANPCKIHAAYVLVPKNMRQMS